ncbi:hypothetical protein CHARACLAT_028782, partial [Characodon lateralis]|nr:hypothetical protein [Characodon lateralis]
TDDGRYGVNEGGAENSRNAKPTLLHRSEWKRCTLTHTGMLEPLQSCGRHLQAAAATTGCMFKQIQLEILLTSSGILCERWAAERQETSFYLCKDSAGDQQMLNSSNWNQHQT